MKKFLTNPRFYLMVSIFFLLGIIIEISEGQTNVILPYLIVSIISFLLCLSLKKTTQLLSVNEYSQLNAPNNPNNSTGTFSFKATGKRYPCKESSRFSEGQTVLMRSKIGDKIALKEYEWEGEPAFY